MVGGFGRISYATLGLWLQEKAQAQRQRREWEPKIHHLQTPEASSNGHVHSGEWVRACALPLKLELELDGI